MRSTHNIVRALGIAIGLGLLMVAGTAAMIAVFSGPTPTLSSQARLVAAGPALEPAPRTTTPGDQDTLKYERVAQSDGNQPWTLIEATGELSTAAAPPSIYAGLPQAVSYTLRLKPSGLSKPTRNCSRSNGYDLTCAT